MAAELEASVWGNAQDDFERDLEITPIDELRQRIRLLDNEVRIMKSDISRIRHESHTQTEHIKENKEKIRLNVQLPYLVANVIELVDPYVDPDADGSAKNAGSQGKGAVVKTSTRQTVFLPYPGLVKASELKPGELVGTNKDSYIILGIKPFIVVVIYKVR